ncbi:hypothetical protein B0B39_10900 [Legionella longbeachae]|uniref:nucleotidyltransferase domain-containing protein n=1 Tax=Legionella longbeachae TaxID=450 RepID=UPI000A1C0428|nr:hypothetical protein B0B39_10900 [Legionella longbeachae]
MSSGIIIKTVKTKFLNIFSQISSVKTIHGFGSFFRSDDSNDIDLLVVLDCSSDKLLLTYYDVTKLIINTFSNFNKKIDITCLTENEFIHHPLLENDGLICLYKKEL